MLRLFIEKDFESKGKKRKKKKKQNKKQRTKRKIESIEIMIYVEYMN